nr:A24 family peptidase [Desulfogranum mediterraneum]
MESMVLVILAVFGAIIGSFLNVVILRLPQEGASIVYPGSHCPACSAPLRWYDNIPLVSYCLIGGRCRYCRTGISLQYPLVEACMAVLSAALFVRVGLAWEYLYYFVFLAGLLVIIFIDIHHQIIPDLISLPGILLGFGGSFLVTDLSWVQSGLGILCGGGVLYLVALGYYLLTRRDGMGGGDIKLLAMIGAFLGWQSLLFVIFFSSLTGSLVGIVMMIRGRSGSQTRVPFGPFLALAAISYLFFSEQISALWQLYLQRMAG